MDCRFLRITQEGKDGDKEACYIANMRDGACAGFKYFDCKGVNRITIKVRGECRGEFAIKTAWDSVPIGIIQVKASNEWKTYYGKISIPDGVCSLYFEYQGSGYVSLTSFTLEKSKLVKRGEKE